MSAPIYVRRREAADYITKKWGLPCSPRTLAKLAVVGGGPVYRKAARTPLYAPSDLDDWASSRIGKPQRSTADMSQPMMTSRER